LRGGGRLKPSPPSTRSRNSVARHPAGYPAVRAERPLPEDETPQIALFTNVPTARRHFRYPSGQYLQDSAVAARAGFWTRSWWRRCISMHAGQSPPNGTRWCTPWSMPPARLPSPWSANTLHLTESYKSLSEALKHAGLHTLTRVNIRYVIPSRLKLKARPSSRRRRVLVRAVSASADRSKDQGWPTMRAQSIPISAFVSACRLPF